MSPNVIMFCSECRVPWSGHICHSDGYPVPPPDPPPWLADPSLLKLEGYRCSACGECFADREEFKSHVKNGHK